MNPRIVTANETLCLAADPDGRPLLTLETAAGWTALTLHHEGRPAVVVTGYASGATVTLEAVTPAGEPYPGLDLVAQEDGASIAVRHHHGGPALWLGDVR